MNPARVTKILGYYEKRWVTASEVAGWLLYHLASEPEIDTVFLPSIRSLPDAVRLEFFGLLQKIQEADYQYSHLMIGGPVYHYDSAKLKHLCIALGIQRPPLSGTDETGTNVE